MQVGTFLGYCHSIRIVKHLYNYTYVVTIEKASHDREQLISYDL